MMEGKVALITGATSGIGQQSAIRFARAGASVVLVGRQQAVLDALVGAIQELGQEALSIAADLADWESLGPIVDQAVDRFGRLDVLVNAAGIIGSGSVSDTTPEAWEHMMRINLHAPFALMQHAMPHLIISKGNVVNVSSVTGVRAFPGVLAYCVSKAGLDQLTRCAALEVAEHGVRVNAINPGVVETNLHRRAGMDDEKYAAFLEHSKTTHPLGRVGQPEEVADLIFFLASPQAGWITGVTLPVDGGRAETCAR